MSDYDYRNPEDPFRQEAAYDPNVRSGNSAWGWVAAAVFVAIVLAVVLAWATNLGRTEPIPQPTRRGRRLRKWRRPRRPHRRRLHRRRPVRRPLSRRRPINRRGSSSGSFVQSMQCGSGVGAGAVF